MDIYVGSGTGDGEAGSQQNPYATISDAVQAAETTFSDVAVNIIVGAGVYDENVIISRSDLTLRSEEGREATEIAGDPESSALGAIQLRSGANNVVIGGEGAGFHIIGLNGNGAIEKAAVYIQGEHEGLVIQDNEIEANGDLGLVSEYGRTVSDVHISGNEFSGKTFEGVPGSAGQFELDSNSPRQLVAINPGSSDVVFENNVITGTAGGFDEQGVVQGNTLVTIDASGSVIENNDFTDAFTSRFGYALRARGSGTDILNNNIGGDSRGILVENQGTPGLYSGMCFSETTATT
jgi:hypothetical protein